MLKILLVDDDLLSVEFMRLSLESPQTTVRGARNCSDARSACLVDCPDVLITDISLDDGSGVDVARHARSCGTQFIVGVTGYDTLHLERLGVDIAEFSQFLTKPLDINVLSAMIEGYRQTIDAARK